MYHTPTTNPEMHKLISRKLREADTLTRRPYHRISKSAFKGGALYAVAATYPGGMVYEVHASSSGEVWCYRDGVLQHEAYDSDLADFVIAADYKLKASENA